MKRLSLLVLSVLLLHIWASAASLSTSFYDISILNQAGKASNVLFVLELKPNVEKALVRLDPKTDALVSDLGVSIEAKTMPRRQTQHSWNFRHHFQQGGMEQGQGLVGRFPLDLAPGTYEIHVELHDLHTNRRYLEILRFDCKQPRQEIQLSDLNLETVKSFGPVSLAQPLNGDRIEIQPDSIRFQAHVFLAQPATLAVRVVLYRRQEEGQDGELQQGSIQVEQFRTYLQATDIWKAAAGERQYAGAFPLTEALDGQYQLELTLYQDDARVAQTTRSFTLEWIRMREIFEDLDRSIRWMKWVATPAEQARLTGITDSDEKQREFIAWWQRRSRPVSGDARHAMKRYFSRIFLASEAIKGEGDGWDTDRGKTMAHFGIPDVQTEIPIPGRKMAVWIYRKWNLAFVFQESAGKMILVRT